MRVIGGSDNGYIGGGGGVGVVVRDEDIEFFGNRIRRWRGGGRRAAVRTENSAVFVYEMPRFHLFFYVHKNVYKNRYIYTYSVRETAIIIAHLAKPLRTHRNSKWNSFFTWCFQLSRVYFAFSLFASFFSLFRLPRPGYATMNTRGSGGVNAPPQSQGK